jgi:Fe-S cluster assembly iron-binding protein IscA
MGLTLDEPKTNDEIIEAEGFSIIVASEVADIIRSYGKLLIDYKDHPWAKGFQLSFPGESSC